MQSQHVNDTTRLKTLGWEEDLVAPPAQGGHSPMAVLTEGNALVNARTRANKRSQAWAYRSAAAFPSAGYRSAASLRTGSPRSKRPPLLSNLKGALCGPFSASASVRSVTKQNFFSPDIHLYIYTGLKISQRMRNERRKGLWAYTASTGLPGFS